MRKTDNQSPEPLSELVPDRDSPNPRDLSDFCQKWNALKIHASKEQLSKAQLSPESKEVISWLTILADKVCHTEDY
ncbi:hypothetical protein [Kiloniella antarctica]|uniref:Uncharacterized protein n=1 Tax=Kiloniella antarctica TaxID=1550907 RepID=A0ABW5BIG9_9PROT